VETEFYSAVDQSGMAGPKKIRAAKNVILSQISGV
jgi:hypothetical protein